MLITMIIMIIIINDNNIVCFMSKHAKKANKFQRNIYWSGLLDASRAS